MLVLVHIFLAQQLAAENYIRKNVNLQGMGFNTLVPRLQTNYL